MATIYAVNKGSKKNHPTFKVDYNEESFLSSVIGFVAKSLLQLDGSPSCSDKRDKDWTDKVHVQLAKLYDDQIKNYDPKAVVEVYSNTEIAKYFKDGRLVATTNNIGDLFKLVNTIFYEIEDATYERGKGELQASNGGYMNVDRFVKFLDFLKKSGGVSVNKKPVAKKKKKKATTKKKASTKKTSTKKKSTKKKKS